MRFRYALFLAMAAIALAAGGASAQERGWALTQRSEALGDQYIYVSPNGFKWQNPKSGANIVSTGPSWGVTMFNDKSRSMYQTTFREWQAQVQARTGGSAAQMQNSAWTKAGSGNIAGLRATKYVMQGGSQPLQAGKRTLASVQSATCWIADEIEIPPALAEMLAAAYGMPKTKYFPLRVTYSSNNGANKVALDTYHSKTCPIPGGFYGYPGGYAVASSQAEVLLDDETRQILEDMAGEVSGRPDSSSTRGTQVRQVRQQSPARVAPTPAAKKNDPLGSLLDSLKGK